MLVKTLLILGGILVLGVILYLIRNILIFTAGLVLLIGGIAGGIVGILLIFVKSLYLMGIGALILSSLLGFIGWELIQKASKVPIPDYASEDQGGFDPTLGNLTARKIYDRHNGSSFGSGF